MQRIKVGIIGCGVIAPTHIESYRKLADVEVAWVCDIVEEKAKKLAEKYGIPRVSADYRDVLADPEVSAVSVCTDHASHAPITAAALEAGKHVLCEKALAASSEGLDLMFAAHRRHPELVFAGVFQHRFEPISQYVKAMIEKGCFGKLLTAGVQVWCLRTNEYYKADAWRGTWAQEGGAVLINQAIHFIDLLVWLAGGVAQISGTYENLTHQGVIETEDTATAAVRFKCGAIGTIEATCSSPIGWQSRLHFRGTEGSLDIRDGRPDFVKFVREDVQKEVEAGLRTAVDAPGELLGKSYYGSGHPAQIADFVSAIAEKRQPFIPASSARHAVDVVLSLYRSWRIGEWVTVPSGEVHGRRMRKVSPKKSASA